LTVEQNLVLSGVPDAKVEELLAQPILAKLQVNPGSLSAGLVSCPGSQFCGFGMIETKGNALKLTSELEELLHIPPGVRIHWTGCPNSCGQAQVADIGLLGTTAKGPVRTPLPPPSFCPAAFELLSLTPSLTRTLCYVTMPLSGNSPHPEGRTASSKNEGSSKFGYHFLTGNGVGLR
jgi:hypothetical protein